MKVKVGPWDPAEVLNTPERIAAYLDVVAEEGDPAHLIHALGVAARAAGMARIAKGSGLNRESLYKALRSTGKPSFGTITKVANTMGLRVSFVPLRPSGRTRDKVSKKAA